MNLDALLKLLNRQVKDAGSQGAWAERNGVPPSLVSAVLRRERAPSTSILEALGLEKVVIYKRKRP
jgi:hypothetical protein